MKQGGITDFTAPWESCAPRCLDCGVMLGPLAENSRCDWCRSVTLSAFMAGKGEAPPGVLEGLIKDAGL